ncbi:MAG: CopD family protein, partial [Chloroflexota bacterium]
MRADPAPGAILHNSPGEVRLFFSEALNLAGSHIMVLGRHDRPMNVGPEAVAGDRREMVVHVRSLPAGRYEVRWVALSADDGHVTQGTYQFGVNVATLGRTSPSNGQSALNLDTVVSILNHALLLLAAASWFGAALVSTVELTRDPLPAEEQRRRRAFIGLAVTVLLATNVLGLLIDLQAVGGSWPAALISRTLSAFFSDQAGRLWIVRVVVALLALSATMPLGVQRPLPGRLSPVVASGPSWHAAGPLQIPLAVIYLYALAASGHAASAAIGVLGGTELLSASILIDLLHLLAVGAWFGGLVYLVLVSIPIVRASSEDLLDRLDRFSPVALGSIALFTVTGPFNAKIHIPSWSALLASVYGRALLVKIGLVGLMLLSGAFAALRLRPRVRASLRVEGAGRSMVDRLIVVLRVQAAIGIGVIVATSVMFYYPVSASLPVSRAPAWRLAGLRGMTVHSLALDRRDSLLAATQQGLYRLGVHGHRHELLSAAGLWSVATAHDGQEIVAGDQGGMVFVSRDGGVHWRSREVARGGVFAVTIRPDDKGALLAGGAGGIYASSNGGRTWARVLPLPGSAVDSFTWRTGTRQVFAGAVAGRQGASTSVYRSRDDGRTWHTYGSRLRDGAGVMSVATSSNGTLLAGTMGHDVWRKPRDRSRWQLFRGEMRPGNHGSSLAIVPGSPPDFFAGTLGQGVYVSHDAGKHWKAISEGLPSAPTDRIVLGLLYA